jgi:hypothetical protein
MNETVIASERPTMAEAFAAPESLAGTTGTPDSTAAPPTAAPGATDQSPASEGPIPYDRHKSILDGAYKERDGYKQQLDALAWAKQVDRQAIEEAERIGKLYQTDRAAFARTFFAEGLTDPEVGPLLRSEAARILAGGRGQQSEELTPDIPVFDANGQQVAQTFSAERVQKIVQRAIAEAIGKEVTPIKQTFEHQQAQAKAVAQRQQAVQQIDAIYQRVEKLPLFKEHDQEIAAAMPEFASAHPAEQVYLAWAKVVLPKLQQTHQAQTLATLEKQAAAAQVNPNAAVVTSQARPTSLLDKSLQW